MYTLATNHPKGDLRWSLNPKARVRRKRGKVKVLKLNKETVKDLTAQERKKIKGGVFCFTGLRGSERNMPMRGPSHP